jgi:hypothetical protein
MLINLPPSVSRLSRHCGILNISQSCRPPRPVIRIALFIFFTSGNLEQCGQKNSIYIKVLGQFVQMTTLWIHICDITS